MYRLLTSYSAQLCNLHLDKDVEDNFPEAKSIPLSNYIPPSLLPTRGNH